MLQVCLLRIDIFFLTKADRIQILSRLLLLHFLGHVFILGIASVFSQKHLGQICRGCTWLRRLLKSRKAA